MRVKQKKERNIEKQEKYNNRVPFLVHENFIYYYYNNKQLYDAIKNVINFNRNKRCSSIGILTRNSNLVNEIRSIATTYPKKNSSCRRMKPNFLNSSKKEKKRKKNFIHYYYNNNQLYVNYTMRLKINFNCNKRNKPNFLNSSKKEKRKEKNSLSTKFT